jgi:hypothetical protein
MSPSGGPYRYSMIARFREQLLEIGRRASFRGVRHELAESLRRIERRLIDSPREWGDPWYRVGGMHLTVFSGRIDFLQVIYAVHDDQPVVFAQSIRPIPGHPLYTGEE